MEYLVHMGILHYELAARNILMFHFDERDPLSTSVKIGGFGSPDDLGHQTHMGKIGQNMKPLRHMAPETLRSAT
jgi:hypothetical protein